MIKKNSSGKKKTKTNLKKIAQQQATRKSKTQRYDLPLNQSRGTGFLIWVITMMVYLATVIVALTIALSAMTDRWTEGLAGKITVEIPFEDFENMADDKLSEKLEQLVRRYNGLDFTTTSRALSQKEIAGMVEPWLGSSDIIKNLPLPRLVHIDLSSSLTPDQQALMKDIVTEIFPNGRIDTHRKWLDDLTTLANAVRFVVGGLGLIIIITAVSAVSGAARSRLAIHAREVTLLHQMGADDSYIAGQFQRQSFRLSLRGGGIGFTLAIATIITAGQIGGHVKEALLPNFSLAWYSWLSLCLVPLAASLIAMIAARITVLRALKKLP
jgi:cell division transport system permease protein